MSTSSAASDAAVEAIVAEFVCGWRGTGVVCGGDVLLRQAGPEVPVLAAGSCRFGCAAVGFDAGDIVYGELLPGSEHLVGEGDRDGRGSPCAGTACVRARSGSGGRGG